MATAGLRRPAAVDLGGESAESAALAASAYAAAGKKDALKFAEKQDAAAAIQFVLGK